MMTLAWVDQCSKQIPCAHAHCASADGGLSGEGSAVSETSLRRLRAAISILFDSQ